MTDITASYLEGTTAETTVEYDAITEEDYMTGEPSIISIEQYVQKRTSVEHSISLNEGSVIGGPQSNSSSDNGNTSPISKRTRGQKPIVQAPLRQAVGPEGTPVHVHVPFTTSDLLNWKQAVGSY
ncbi:hypothetical protein QYF61_010097 [Mycteria americana]|uniref:Uncharacterized protein n=1 Tax=Mycteria americana TaxID=33587 RepID=A0AAN7PS02_MYCAM|nr:hypothetical protein QYF61_010097 [Mycteria americana]